MLTINIITFYFTVKEGVAVAFVLCFFFSSTALSGNKREPQTRVGLVTSSLPRKRSTTELLRLFAFTHSLFLCTLLFRSGPWLFAPVPAFLERKTGLEPATYSLEGYRSTK